MRRVLIHRLGSLGDTVVALPCFHLIARTFPHAERRLLTDFPVHAKAPSSAAVLGDSGLVDGYMRYTAGTRNPLELLRLAVGIRHFRPDVLVYLTHIRPWKDVQRDRLFLRVAGVRRIVGIAGETEIKPVFDAATGRYESESARLARLVAELGDANPADRASWDLMLSDAEREAAREALGALAHRPLIVCGPGTKRPAKDWGQENWRALLAELSGRYRGYCLALVGAQEESLGADYAARQWAGPKLNLCGRLTPRAMAAALCYAKVFSRPRFRPHARGCSCGGALRDCFLCQHAARKLVPAWRPAPGALSTDQLPGLLPGILHGRGPALPHIHHGCRYGRGGGQGAGRRALSLRPSGCD
jgi:heptosyltransferase-3